MSVGSVQPFLPTGTVALSASTTSENATLIGAGGSVLVYNSTAAVAFVQLGAGSLVATVADGVPVPPGDRALFQAGPLVSAVAVLLSSGSGTVYATRGEGTAY